MRLDYPIELEPLAAEDGGGFQVVIPDWSNAVTHGDDLDGAIENARDCLEELIADRVNRREPFPTPSPAFGRRVVSPEARLALKAGLWLAMREQGVSFDELAARLGLPSAAKAEELLDPRRRTRPELLEAAAGALGKRVAVELRDAA
jgi:antitoxin HicB